jgi:hypothetical protein
MLKAVEKIFLTALGASLALGLYKLVVWGFEKLAAKLPERIRRVLLRRI